MQNHLYGPLIQQAYRTWEILRSFSRFGDKLPLSLQLLLTLLLLLQCLPLLQLLQLQSSFLRETSQHLIIQQPVLEDVVNYTIYANKTLMLDLAQMRDTFNLVVFSWSIIISFLMFTSLLW